MGNIDLTKIDKLRIIGSNENIYIVKKLNTEDYKKRAMNLVWGQIFESDPIIAALNFDQESKESLRIWIRQILDKEVAYGCFLRSTDNLVAVDLQHVDNNEYEIQNLDRGKAFGEFGRYRNIIRRYIGPKSYVTRIKYLTSIGVFVKPSYRDLDYVDIEREMIKFRLKLRWILYPNTKAGRQTVATRYQRKFSLPRHIGSH